MLIERKEHIEADNTIGYIETVINSDNILKTLYFPKSKRLFISFKRGGTYSYSNINNDMYNEFEEAESHGKFFHARINNKSKYPFRKEFTLYPTEIKEINKIIEDKINEINENNIIEE